MYVHVFSIKLIHPFLPERVVGSDLLLFMAGGGERLTRSATSLHHLYIVPNHLARAPSQQSFLPSYSRHVRGSRLSHHRLDWSRISLYIPDNFQFFSCCKLNSKIDVPAVFSYVAPECCWCVVPRANPHLILLLFFDQAAVDLRIQFFAFARHGSLRPRHR
jgi:hypothetical protein